MQARAYGLPDPNGFTWLAFPGGGAFGSGMDLREK
jgi:hypothetical protein